jgi:hypothetical protein
MVDLAHGTGVVSGRPLPAVLPLGADCYDGVKGVCEAQVATMAEWKDVICSTDFS